MSTKIYNGYKIPLMTVAELNDFILSFKKEAKKIAEKSAATFVANIMTSMIDEALFLDEKEYIQKFIKDNEGIKSLSDLTDKRLFREAYEKGRKRYEKIEKTGMLDPVVDYDCEIVFIPLEDKILCLFFGENNQMKEYWESLSEVSYYGYWNNTDPDENCTEKEWEIRSGDWLEALENSGVPSECGMTVVINKGFPGFGEIRNKVINAFPLYEKRVEVITEMEVLKKLIKEEEDKEENKENKEKEAYEIYTLARKEIKTNVGKLLMTLTKLEVEKKLVKSFEDDVFFLRFDKLKHWITKKTNA